MKIKRFVLAMLKTRHRRYRVQKNGAGEYRVQCNDTGTPWGWQTQGRRDGRNQWNAFVTDSFVEVEDFLAEKREEHEEDQKRCRWQTLPGIQR
jgi:hypothetical protein